MRTLLLTGATLALIAAAAPAAAAPSTPAQAARVTITRDDWGIAHIHGKTDADAVFGMIYAQAEDDFPRIEANYLTALGRTAEADGEGAIWQDLRARLYVSEAELKAHYAASPPAMRKLMDAWAAGLNLFLATHPEVKPRVLTHFEPWMALSFTEGSIGGNIEKIDLAALQAFYGGPAEPKLAFNRFDPNDPRGSNGIAIAPAKTESRKALLLINPHTSFFFRSELQMQSDEGLDAYGAVTWGQFFIYQGFNAHAGWMHTSSGVDNVDEFAYEVRAAGNGHHYRYGKAWRAMQPRSVTIRYRTPSGEMASREFTTWRTHRGPVVRADGKKWVAFAMMDRPVAALQQSFLRTKATDLASFMKVAALKANSSNATIFADSKGEIAYLHPQFVPRRDDRFDYTMPVDGSDPRTDWGPVHRLEELPNAISPANGWVMNTNNWPYTAAGDRSPKRADFPRYMDAAGENARGIHAAELLKDSEGWTLEGLNAAAYDSRQPGFGLWLPGLIAAYDALPADDPRRARLAGPITELRGWDTRWSVDSVPNSIANFWALALWQTMTPGSQNRADLFRLMARASGEQKLTALDTAMTRMVEDFGRWQVPWGEINRFQRISPAIDHPFSDAAPSIPVGFTSSLWGSLAAFEALPKPGTKKWYGTKGNSFVAVVEFGPTVRAHAVTAGGESGDPSSPHFNDQAERYATGNLRPVYFTAADLKAHTARTYHPGDK